MSRLLLGGLKQFELRDSHLVVRSSLGDLGSLNISRLRWQNQGRGIAVMASWCFNTMV